MCFHQNPPNFSSFLRNSKISTKNSLALIRADLSFVAFLVVFVHGSVALGPPPPLFAFPSLNFADFPRIRGSFGAQFRPISSQTRADPGAAVPAAVPGGTTARADFSEIFSFPRFVFGISSLV